MSRGQSPLDWNMGDSARCDFKLFDQSQQESKDAEDASEFTPVSRLVSVGSCDKIEAI